MKENLKVLNINGETEWREVKSLFFSLGFSSVISGLTFLFTDKQRLPCRDITLPELRELARPKEYLNDKFELVVTNRPDDGWVLVPDGAETLTPYDEHDSYPHGLFWKKVNKEDYCLNGFGDWNPATNTMEYFINRNKKKILWQRENKVETVKGRFLHQWAYEAFGRGEDVQISYSELDNWNDICSGSTINTFNCTGYKFRLKPQTIQIGSRTITKPISVKPERGTTIYIAMLTDNDKYDEIVWNDYPEDRLYLSRNLCHLTAADAVAMTDALLELMK